MKLCQIKLFLSRSTSMLFFLNPEFWYVDEMNSLTIKWTKSPTHGKWTWHPSQDVACTIIQMCGYFSWTITKNKTVLESGTANSLDDAQFWVKTKITTYLD